MTVKHYLRPQDIETIARTCHEVNRVWCAFNGDTSQLPWEFAPDWQKASAREGVLFVFRNPNAPDSATHDSWAVQKATDGWVYGPVKDAEAKTHPCLVPFGELPPAQQFKDRLFRTIVLAMIEAEPVE